MARRSKIVPFKTAKSGTQTRKPIDADDISSIKSDVIYRDSNSVNSPARSGSLYRRSDYSSSLSIAKRSNASQSLSSPNRGSYRKKASLSPEDSGKLADIFAIDFQSRSLDSESVFASSEFDNLTFGITEQDIDEFEQDIVESKKKSKLAEFFSDSKRKRNKERAEKKFAETYEDGSGSVIAFDSSSSKRKDTKSEPHAAIYEAKMGGRQKRAQKLQRDSSSFGNSAKGAGLGAVAKGVSGVSEYVGGFFADTPKPQRNRFVLPTISRSLVVSVTLVVIVAVFAGMLYTPTQQYYQQMRERDRLNAEYEAILERNENLQSLVDNLQSDEGIEDQAHAEFGMVKTGEYAGSVTGIDVVNSSKFQANIAPGSVPAPETWYSGFLDVFFLYKNGY